jgi:hypothetical protein
MTAMWKPGKLSALLSLLFLCPGATQNCLCSTLPAEISMNPEAGRGGPLIVKVRLEGGEEMPFVVDTGSGTLFDKSLEAKLGKPVGTETVQRWGTHQKVDRYAMPRLYLGGALLTNDGETFTYDLQQVFGLPGLIGGILGYDCLRHYCVQMDFAAGKMRFLEGEHADKKTWGRAFPVVALNSKDGRPAVAENLFGEQGPHSLIDTGYLTDGWLMPKYFRLWTNQAVLLEKGKAQSPNGLFGGEKYSLVSLRVQDVESDGIGLRFLGRHLVTLDFPNQTMYLQRQSSGPLSDLRLKMTGMDALEPLVTDVLQEDAEAARIESSRIEQSNATELAKAVARKLAASLGNDPKPTPADIASGVSEASLGDLRPERAEVGWLKPAANRIPPNDQIRLPFLDCEKIYATGLYAHAPSRYVYELGGKWTRLRGEAGLHTTFQPYAAGVVFVIKTDGKEVFRSSTVRGSDRAKYDVALTGVRTLELLVEKANAQNGGNWALWLDPMLSRASSTSVEGY